MATCPTVGLAVCRLFVVPHRLASTCRRRCRCRLSADRFVVVLVDDRHGGQWSIHLRRSGRNFKFRTHRWPVVAVGRPLGQSARPSQRRRRSIGRSVSHFVSFLPTFACCCCVARGGETRFGQPMAAIIQRKIFQGFEANGRGGCVQMAVGDRQADLPVGRLEIN